MKKVPSIIDFDNNSNQRWNVEIDGEKVKVNTRLSIFHEKFARIDYGMTALGYDAIAIEEIGGGGSVIVPYFIHDKKLYIGLVEQLRPNQMSETGSFMVWNLPRGYIERNSHLETVKIESHEELIHKHLDLKFKKISRPQNPNSGYFVTIPEGKKGVVFYALEIDTEYLIKHRDDTYVLKRELRNKHPEADQEEIFKVEFFNYEKNRRIDRYV